MLDPKQVLRIEEEKLQAICSFHGSCANRGNGMSAASFDEVRGAECSLLKSEPSIPCARAPRRDVRVLLDRGAVER